VEGLERKAFFPINVNQASADHLVNIRLIQAVEMTSQRIIIEPRRLQPRPDQLRQIDLMRPSLQMDERLSSAQDIQKDQLDRIAGSGLALGIHRNQPIDELEKVKILEKGTYYIQIGTVINLTNLNIHGGQTPLHSLCVKDSFHIDAKKSSRFSSEGCEM